ncbi:DUF5626 family protein [Carnobacterium mobile]|uniref:DUF5626 family protein n=1 Tax=Carnobacterium mobile TaxID=2750 RepID=UPI0018693C5C|nr:DUF5626 family protein [Carnobacterium mobile]
MKKILLILGLIAFISFGAQEVQAEAAQPTGNQEKIIYDLEQGGTQSFTVVTSAGEEIVIEVEEIPSMLRAVKNGNKITKAYSPSIVAYTGSFTSAKLTVTIRNKRLII